MKTPTSNISIAEQFDLEQAMSSGSTLATRQHRSLVLQISQAIAYE
jgi:hypothetical protein